MGICSVQLMPQPTVGLGFTPDIRPCAMLPGWMIEAVASPCRISNGIRSARAVSVVGNEFLGHNVYEQVVLAGEATMFFFCNCWPST